MLNVSESGLVFGFKQHLQTSWLPCTISFCSIFCYGKPDLLWWWWMWSMEGKEDKWAQLKKKTPQGTRRGWKKHCHSKPLPSPGLEDTLEQRAQLLSPKAQPDGHSIAFLGWGLLLTPSTFKRAKLSNAQLWCGSEAWSDQSQQQPCLICAGHILAALWDIHRHQSISSALV